MQVLRFPFTSIAIYFSPRHFEQLAPPTWLMYMAYIGALLMLWVIARVRFNEIER